MNKFILGLFLLLFGTTSFTQVIMTVDGEEIDITEFKRMYEQSSENANYSEQSINDYLHTFTEEKLQLADAKAKGLDKDPEMLRKMAIYEEKLIQDEFDREMMNGLMNEVKNRLQEEVCAQHILLEVRRNSSPDDTLFVYNKAVRLRNELVSGADFNHYVKRHSADLDTKYNEGSLGCFTALQLSSHNLESEIYNLYPGQYSMPIRSKRGYHIVKVTDRRPSSGMVTATQLFARANETQEQELNFEAERRIQTAHYQLTQGKDFDEVVADFLTSEEPSELQVSEDEIDWFTVGTYESDFENAIFALNKEEFSKPIKTSLGWHIFRLNDRKPLPKFEEIEGNVRDAIMEDERYFKSKMKFAEKIKHQYDYESNQENIISFAKEVASGISIKGWQTPSMFDYSKELFKIDNRIYTAQNFVNYVKDQHTLGRFYSFKYYYDTFESNKLLDYHRHNLIDKSPSLQAKIKEYLYEMLLSNYVGKEEKPIEKPQITTNSPEVKAYYENHTKQYEKMGLVYIKKYEAPLTNSKELNKLKVFANVKKADFFTKMALKKSVPQPVEIMEVPIDKAIIGGVNYANQGAKGTQIQGGKFEYLITTGIEESEVLPYETVKEKVLADYLAVTPQQEEEKESLQDKYPYSLEVNEEVVQSLYR